MEFLFDYLGFLAKTATVVVAALIVLSSVAAMSAHRAMRSPPGGHIQVIALNERLQDMQRTIEEAALPPAVIKKRRKSDAKARKRHRKEEAKRAKAEARRQRKDKEVAHGPSGTTGAGGAVAKEDVPATPAAEPDSSAEPDSPTETAASAEPDDSGAVQAVDAASASDQSTSADGASRRVFVLTFNGDLVASGVESLRREISAVLGAASEGDELVVRVESAGGMVHGYGLGASQLARVRGHGLRLTVAVDKVAASGGYLMAAVADRILAAPFAVVGSIGVVAQIPNVHRLLKKHDVDVEVLTAGRFKRTLDFLGENTEQGREKFREELQDVHELFQEFVGNWRPALDLETVSTGEAWYGQRALERALVDELITSDEYLVRACNDADVFEVSWVEPKRPIDKFLGQAAAMLGKTAGKALDALLDRTTTGGIR